MTRSSPYLDEILRLDPVADHKRIMHLVVCYEFPFDTTRSLEMAFFRTYAVPAIGERLDSTREFALRALRRMNQIHGRFRLRTRTSCTSSPTSSSSPCAGPTASA